MSAGRPVGPTGPDGGGPQSTGPGRDTPPAGYREERLREMPSLPALYARAVARTGRLVLATIPARDLPPVVLRVDGVRADPTRLAEYQHLVGEPGTDNLPAGFVHVTAFPLAMAIMVREDFPLGVLGMVHVANRVEVRRQLTLDDVLTVRAWATGARTHHRGVTVDLVVEVSAGDELAWRGVSTYLAKGRPPRGLTVAEAAPRSEPARPPSTPTALWRLTPRETSRYADVSGDRNPIHVSRLGARLFGFRRPIAHGMDTAARALAGAPARLRRAPLVWTVEFGKPVLLPTTAAYAVGKDGTFVVWNRRSGGVHASGTVRPQ
ncbi:MaoC/PaaZ C-terminal domain-containing protein [Georgenia deserti]|uniref:MaoC/PaaZ C-terminal domain-containing protein n=1 Tax=Georgenia deserti TaxID=2093781 RepID=A0ABW4KY46_9MICO